ncbi:MAG: hypothetical protein IK076_04555, partial [Bacteroidales bacterium]|nr:hypothetical protein [Bacteroidales bacterium]
MEGSQEKKRRPAWRRILRTVLWTLLGLWAIVMVVLQVVLNSSFLEGLVKNLAGEYVEGEVSFSKIKASVFRSFPNLNISIDDFSIVYPHEMFAAYDSLIPPGDSLHFKGWGESMDTLAHFDHFSIAVDYVRALRGHIDVGHAILEHPRIFIHRYDSTRANWNILRIPSSEEEDTSAIKIPPLTVGKVSLSDAPYAVFTSLCDTLAASLALDHLMVKNHREHYDIDLDSRVSLNTGSTGKMDLPFKLDTKFYPDFENNIYSLK